MSKTFRRAIRKDVQPDRVKGEKRKKRYFRSFSVIPKNKLGGNRNANRRGHSEENNVENCPASLIVFGVNFAA